MARGAMTDAAVWLTGLQHADGSRDPIDGVESTVAGAKPADTAGTQWATHLQGPLPGVQDVGVQVPHDLRQVVDGVHPLPAPAAAAQLVGGALTEAAFLVFRLRDLQPPHRRVPLLQQLIHLLRGKKHIMFSKGQLMRPSEAER